MTFASASAAKRRAGVVPRARYTVSCRWCTTAEMSAFSSNGSSSSVIQVPPSSSNEERTLRRTLCVRAISIERAIITPAPDDVISSISSKLTRSSLRASGTSRGSALNTPRTSV